jgi:UbiD family decarboxylase
MHTMAEPAAVRRTREQRTAPKQDLRAWLAAMEAAGELSKVDGAEREQEIGGIVDIYQRTRGSPAVLFDDIPGYPRGYRVVANILTSVRRINLTLGLDIEAPEMDLVRYWRNYMKQQPAVAPVTVTSGPLLDNVSSDGDVDLLRIPTPRWHEHDGATTSAPAAWWSCAIPRAAGSTTAPTVSSVTTARSLRS